MNLNSESGTAKTGLTWVPRAAYAENPAMAAMSSSQEYLCSALHQSRQRGAFSSQEAAELWGDLIYKQPGWGRFRHHVYARQTPSVTRYERRQELVA